MNRFTATAKRTAARVTAVAAIAGALCTIQLQPSGAATTGPKLVPTSGRLIGLHADNTDAVEREVFKNLVDRRELDAGRKLDVQATQAYGFNGTFPSWRETWMAGTGHIPLVSWSAGYSPAVANGSKDAVLDARAAAVRSFGKPMFLAYAPSMDRADPATVVSPAGFVAAWRRAHARFAASNATNAVWVWCPSAAAWANGTAMQWYPGDAYVDWTCAEGANTGSPWTPFASLFRPFVDRATAIGKPQLLTFGSREGTPGQKATWIEWAFRSVAGYYPTVKAAVYDDRWDQSVSTSPSAAAAFSAAIVDPALYTPPAVTLPGGPLVPSSGTYVGTFQPSTTQAAEIAGITALETAMGRKQDIAHVFYGWDDAFPTWREPWHLQSGRIPLVSWGGVSSTEVSSGRYDALIRTRARGLRDLGSGVFLRWFWEMDGEANRTRSVSGPAFVTAWQRIHRLFREEGAGNVAFVWSPNAWGIESGVAQAYYPGGPYVDWIAADGYNWAPRRPGSRWTSFTNVFGVFYGWAQAQGKPIMLAEVGVMERNAGEKAQWLRDMGTSLKVGFPRVRAVVYFDHTTTSYTDGATLFPWNLTSSSGAMSAWRSVVTTPRLQAIR